MAKRILLALLALFSVQAFASNQKPPDVPAYVTVNATYASGSTLNKLGDGVNTRGSNPPAYAYELTDPNPVSETGWIVTSTTPQDCSTFGAGCFENKLRSQSNGSIALYDDPIRNYGEPGASHLHCFFGSKSPNAFSTYATLRNRPGSNFAGGPMNATAYWLPCPVKTNPFGDGKNYAPKITDVVVYYNGGDLRNSNQFTRIPLGLRYVFGKNMDDPNEVGVLAEIAAANAVTPGRYSANNGNNVPNHFRGWICLNGSSNVLGADGKDSYPSLKNADGTDPWGGTCTSGMTIYPSLGGPDCWDGTNLWAPGGYKLMRYSIYDSVSGTGVCPNGWYRVAPPQLSPHFGPHGGFADYGTWRLSSDDAMQTKLTALGTPRTIMNGESMHTDWLGGWQGTIFAEWQNYCIGAGGNTAHECNVSEISQNQTTFVSRGLQLDNAPDGSRSPQIRYESAPTSSASNMFLLPSQTYTGARVHDTH